LKVLFSLFFVTFFSLSFLSANDLDDIKSSGKLRHLGIPYANFVTGLGDGLDTELMQKFAKHLGVDYEYVPSTWDNIYGDLIGRNVKYENNEIKYLENTTIKGDVIANGLTILPWREKVVSFSNPTFPSSVWIISKANSELNPISPSKSLRKDILNIKELITNKTVLTKPNTCLDASLYDLDKTQAKVVIHPNNKKIIEMVPSVINSEVELTLLDVPDALIALEKFSGEIKVLGPISEKQFMGVAFRKESTELLKEFNKFFEIIKNDGTYNRLVHKYYPSVFYYFDDFFK
jgi:ABC-type amino acid transport substrate-binding protein